MRNSVWLEIRHPYSAKAAEQEFLSSHGFWVSITYDGSTGAGICRLLHQDVTHGFSGHHYRSRRLISPTPSVSRIADPGYPDTQPSLDFAT
jgi:hypothetical protein